MDIQGKMFEAADVRRTRLGKKLYRIACKQCGLERWVAADCLRRSTYTGLCLRCAAARLRKDRRIDSHGYAFVKLQPDDFFYPMADSYGYVREHRLIMAKHLHRCLLAWEVVHHKGTKYPMGSKEDKADNRIENLELLAIPKFHLPSVNVQAVIRRLERVVEQQGERITLLEAENVVLRKALVDGNLIELVIP